MTSVIVHINCHIYKDLHYRFQPVLQHVIHSPVSFGITQTVTRLVILTTFFFFNQFSALLCGGGQVITSKLTASGLLLILMQVLGEFYKTLPVALIFFFLLNRIPDMLPHLKLFIVSHFQPLFVNK